MKRYFLPSGQELVNVHDESLCEGRPCVIHNPSGHRMSGWPLHWRGDRGIFERICIHGVGHPDPDQFDYWLERDGELYEAVHGCDFCCGDPYPDGEENYA